jgi:hypothetical protein
LSRAKLAQLVTSTEATTQGIEVLAERGKAIRERRDAAIKATESGGDDVLVIATETPL